MLGDEFVCEARVRFRGKDLALNKIIADITLEEIIPPRRMIVDPQDLVTHQARLERRTRIVDMIASEFAHALIEALYKSVER